MINNHSMLFYCGTLQCNIIWLAVTGTNKMHLCWKILEARKAEIIETNASFVPQSTLLLVMSAYCSSYNHYQQSGEHRAFAISSSNKHSNMTNANESTSINKSCWVTVLELTPQLLAQAAGCPTWNFPVIPWPTTVSTKTILWSKFCNYVQH